MPFYTSGINTLTVLSSCAVIVATLLHVVAFSIPNWLESLPDRSEFLKIGFHEACFNGYRHPDGDFDTKYFGCHHFYSLYFRDLRGWLTPDWFLHVRVIAIANLPLLACALILAILCLIMVAIERCARRSRGRDITLQGMLFLSSVLDLAIAIIGIYTLARFSLRCFERSWMPRPEVNVLGKSFWMEVTMAGLTGLAFLGNIIAAILKTLSMQTIKDPRYAEDMMLTGR